MFVKAFFSFFILLWLTAPQSYANTPFTQPEQVVKTAKPLLLSPQPATETISVALPSRAELQQNPALTEALLHKALELGAVNDIRLLLDVYRQFLQQDPILVRFAQAQLSLKNQQYAEAIQLYRQILAQNPSLTAVRLQLAIALFYQQQARSAMQQFEQVLSDEQLPADMRALAQRYQQWLEQRNQWQIGFSATYLHEKNVNRASSARYIENTPFIKGDSMLPQRANGVGYGLNLERQWNLLDSHNALFSQGLAGKYYWDNHAYDELTSRTQLGYRYKTAQQAVTFLPFFEHQWFGRQRYKKAVGGRAEWHYSWNSNWQLSSALEYSRNQYLRDVEFDGSSRLASATLLWRPEPEQFWALGADVAVENTQMAWQSNHLYSLRFAWGQEFRWGISLRFGFSASERRYQAPLKLSSFQFDKPRQDRIYSANLTLWKRDWHYAGFTPKLNFRWKKQQSNFASLYAYQDRGVQLFIEKNF